MEIVEVGLKLEKDFDYYDKLLKKNGLKQVKSVQTHDLYYANCDLKPCTEKEMKDACIRLRSSGETDFIVQNKLIPEITQKVILR